MYKDQTISTPGKPLGKALLYTLPMFLITFMFLTGGRPDFTDTTQTVALLTTFMGMNLLYFLMHFTGKTDRYRAVIFIIFALSLSFTLIKNMVEIRNSMSFSQADIVECKIPFCHLVIPMMIIPAAFTKSIIFPGTIIGGFADISSMVVLWLIATLVLGRGFCSWGCFYGGWDDGFSRFRKRPALRKISDSWKWMPFAVLLMVALTAALTLIPTYCDWMCPFKAVTEFEQVTNLESGVKAGVFISLFGGLVVALPVMSRKRTQCSFLCPLGAVNTVSNKVTPFTIKIDKTACNECYKCVEVCPLFALTPDDVKRGKASVFCSKCGKCVDACTKKAIHFGIKGVPAGTMKGFSRNLFLFVSFLFIAVFSSGSIMFTVRSLLNLIF
ncbi:MAG: 4Fe-4S binding protein [Bacteroidales bacterium]|jgi:polyferredoxin|nr:4Fe-4S binding protein [Bacteroidales bacterium]